MRLTRPGSACGHVRGFTLIEVLIALIVLAFGMLALARGLGRSAQGELEAQQRMQAMTIVAEMASRIANNPRQAVDYVGDYVPGNEVEDCTQFDAAVPVPRDRCEWRNRLRGADIFDGKRAIGAPIASRGCVINTAPNVYVIAVAWQGVLPTEPADSPCGQEAFGADNENTRRVYSTTLQIATLGV
jgi:type IV pilus assembly protein PilV